MSFDRIPARPSKTHPILSSMQFASLTHDVGGATMNLHTGRLLQAHQKGYVVGGERDRAGARVPTLDPKPTKEQVTPAFVLAQRERLRGVTDSPNASLGSWTNDNGTVDIDASSVYESRKAAKRLGKRRNEDAVWDNGRMKNLRTKFPKA